MSAVPNPQQEFELQRRIEMLEARIIQLEKTLLSLLGEPQDAAASVTVDRTLLRTQPLPTAQRVSGAANIGNAVARAAEVTATALRGMRGGEEAPASSTAASSVSAPASSAPRPTLVPPPAAPAPAQLEPFNIAPPQQAKEMFSLDDEEPAAPAPAAQSATTKSYGIDLGLTGAFSTLEAKVNQAADADLAASLKRAPLAPDIDLMPELLKTQRMPATRKLEVQCALELLNPSILQQIITHWERPDCGLRLQRLVSDDHGGRMGLDPLVREEVALLAAVHERARS